MANDRGEYRTNVAAKICAWAAGGLLLVALVAAWVGVGHAADCPNPPVRFVEVAWPAAVAGVAVAAAVAIGLRHRRRWQQFAAGIFLGLVGAVGVYAFEAFSYLSHCG